MALIYPLARNGASLYGYECTSASGFVGRGFLCLLDISPAQAASVFPAQKPALADGLEEGTEALPVMMFDDPASTLENLVFAPEARILKQWRSDKGPCSHRLKAISDLHYINIICTELQEKRLILAGGDAGWRTAVERSKRSPKPPEVETRIKTSSLHLQPPRPEDAIPVMLINEERGGFAIEAVHRILSVLPGFDGRRFLDQARLFFHIEHLPGVLTPERITYLLSHGNELGPAMIALAGVEGYLMKARVDVVEAIFSTPAPSTPDIAVLELLLKRVLKVELFAREAEADLLRAIAATREGAPLAFCLNPPTLAQIQDAALHRRPLPANTFRIWPQPPREWIQQFL